MDEESYEERLEVWAKEDKFYSEGWDAYWQHRPQDNNPYPKISNEYKYWFRGWCDANIENQDRSPHPHPDNDE